MEREPVNRKDWEMYLKACLWMGSLRGTDPERADFQNCVALNNSLLIENRLSSILRELLFMSASFVSVMLIYS